MGIIKLEKLPCNVLNLFYNFISLPAFLISIDNNIDLSITIKIEIRMDVITAPRGVMVRLTGQFGKTVNRTVTVVFYFSKP